MKKPQIVHSATESFEARRRRRRAGAFRHSKQMERLAEMRSARPDEYAKLTPQMLMSVGYYLEAKEAAEAEGLDTTGDDAA